MIDALLFDQIIALVRRQNLADPVGYDLDRGGARQLGQALAPPARYVGAKRVVRVERNIHFGRENPSAGAAAARPPVEGAERAEHAALGCAMASGGGVLLD